MNIPTTTWTKKRIGELDPAEQHEALLEMFGEHVFWARNSVVETISRLITDDENRERLASLYRKPFDLAASLGADEQQILIDIMKSGIDDFAKEILRLLGNEGLDLRINESEAIRYRLDAEVCSAETGDVEAMQTISRGGVRFLPECWGRWLNKFRRK